MKKPKRKSKAIAVVKQRKAVAIIHPLVAMAQLEPDVRRKRFLVMLATVIPHLSPDDLHVIEPILYRAYGRAAAEHAEDRIPPLESK